MQKTLAERKSALTTLTAGSLGEQFAAGFAATVAGLVALAVINAPLALIH